MSINSKILFISLIFTIFPILGFAGSPSDILINMVPENPAPGENVNISLNSYAYNLNTVLISWYVNNKKSSEGIGKKSFSLQAGNINTENVVSVKIKLPDGEIEVKIVVKGSNMVLLWQAEDSYVPPFYKGKALPSPDSNVKVVALPEIIDGKNMVDPNNMTYAWKLDYSNDGDASGYGKNYFIYTNDYLEKSNTVSVTAETTDQKYSVANSIDINTTEPKILFYKKDPGLGTLWENAISNNYKMEEDEILEAAAYFISPKNLLNPILSWSWSINGAPVYLESIINNIIPLRKQTGVSGTAKLKLQIENKYKVFQTTSKEINIQF